MNWYEFASADEVKEILEQLLHTYGFSDWTYAYNTFSVKDDENYKIYTYPAQKFEIAEALWGEFSEQFFD